jgi:ubiquinol-cytochrome c reductase cytochrome b subunit
LRGDRASHNLLERPRDAPRRTAFGAAFLTWVVLVFFAGSSDRIFVFLGLSYVTQVWFWRFAVWIAPLVVAVVVARWCRALQRAEQIEAYQEEAMRDDVPETESVG